MNWNELIQNLGIFTIALGILAFLAKSLFTHYMNQKINEHKHKLQLITQEHQIRYSKLHQERAEVIKILYNKLIKMEESMFSYLKPIRLSNNTNRNELQELAYEAAKDFFSYFYENEIFFDDGFCKTINKMNEVYYKSFTDVMLYDDEQSQEIAKSNREFRKERADALKKAWREAEREIPPIKNEMKSHIRTLLGVESTNI